MKAESTKKLRQVYNITEDTGIRRLIEEIFRIEENQPTGKFNWYNYTMEQKSIYTALTGVYHEDGYKIACDRHILIARREEYPTDLEKKIVNKAGEILPNKYPNWGAVIPEPIKENCELFIIDFARIAEIRKETKALKKLNRDSAQYIHIGEFYYSAELVCKLVSFMDYAHTSDYYQHKHGLIFLNCEGVKAVVQPMSKQPKGENITIYEL